MGVNRVTRYVKAGMLLMVCAGFFGCSGSEESETVGNWKWQTDISSMERAFAVGVVVDDIIYYGLGYNGTNSTQTRLKDWYSFDAITKAHVKLANFEGQARQQAVAFAIGKKIYVGTGYDGTNYFLDFWEYDIDGNSWTQVDALPSSTFEEEGYDERGRYGSVAFSLKVANGNTYGYVGTGISRIVFRDTDNDGSVKEVFSTRYNNDFYRFDPSAGAGNMWTPIKPFPSNRCRSATFTIKNENNIDDVYVCTGGTGSVLTDFYKFIPGNDGIGSWEEKRKISPAGDPYRHYNDLYGDIARYDAVAWAADGRGYLALGTNGTTWEYNPDSDLWRRKTTFEGPSSSRAGALAFHVRGFGYVMTGGIGNTYYTDVWLFQPNSELYRGDNGN